MVDPAWNFADLARKLCDDLVERGQLRAKPAFIREDREARLTAIFEECGLNGARMHGLTNPGPLEQMVRKATQGEVWVDETIRGLIAMLPSDVARAEKEMEIDDESKDIMSSLKEKAQRRLQDDEDGRGGRKGKGKGKGKGGYRDDDYGGGGFRDDRGGECYNCGEIGHLARDCPSKGSSRSGKGGSRFGGSSDMECFNCGQIGHPARDCPEPRKGKGGGGGGRDSECFNCGGFGHLARDCPEPRQGRGGGKGRGNDRDTECYNCNQFGHLARDCPEPRRPKGGGKGGRRRDDDERSDRSY